MRIALLLALAASAAAQPAPPTFQPLHASVAQAYLYSVGATAGTVGLGLALVAVLPEGDPTRDSFTPREIGWVVVATGAIGGPSVGNLTLGAGDDVGRAVGIKGAGVAVGGGLVLLALGASFDCAFGGAGCDAAGVLFTAGLVVTGGGLVSGTVYDLVTIPRNAARARARLRGPRVAVEPRGLGLAVRVGL